MIADFVGRVVGRDLRPDAAAAMAARRPCRLRGDLWLHDVPVCRGVGHVVVPQGAARRPLRAVARRDARLSAGLANARAKTPTSAAWRSSRPCSARRSSCFRTTRRSPASGLGSGPPGSCGGSWPRTRARPCSACSPGRSPTRCGNRLVLRIVTLLIVAGPLAALAFDLSGQNIGKVGVSARVSVRRPDARGPEDVQQLHARNHRRRSTTRAISARSACAWPRRFMPRRWSAR